MLYWGIFQNGTEPAPPCLVGVHGFTSAFLFSVETQHTIGFGTRATTEECPEAIFVLCIQAIAGMLLKLKMILDVVAKFFLSESCVCVPDLLG